MSSENLILNIIPQENFYKYLKILCDILMVFSPSIGYIAQAMKFKETKSSEGFSKYMCLILLFANLLRIFFWIGKQFTIILLYQSIVVILSQLYLIHSSLKYDKSIKLPNDIEKAKEKSIALNQYFKVTHLFKKEKFWKWENELEYYKFIIIFLLSFSVLCNFIGFQNNNFVNLIGTISAFSESIIPLPQIKNNYITKNVSNISSIMIFMWLGGDIFKTIYYIFTSSPIQMIICGFFVISLDIILSFQVIIYSESNKGLNEKKNEKDEEAMDLINEIDDDDDLKINVDIKKINKKKMKNQNK